MKIYGYLFKIVTKKVDCGYTAFAPGVGGVYEEGNTKEEAVSNAYESACAIIETRLDRNDPIKDDNEYLKVLDYVPNLSKLAKIGKIENEYIATPRCLIPVGAN